MNIKRASISGALLNRQLVNTYVVWLFLPQKKEFGFTALWGKLCKSHPHVQLGLYPSQEVLLLEFCGPSQIELQELSKAIEQKLFDALLQEALVAKALHSAFISLGKTLALAESCTGGAFAASLTRIPGASRFLLGSIVAYSNDWKNSFLGVSSKTLQQKGAVSFEAVEEMVAGLFERTSADFTVAISGIVGPTGGSAEKPVGSVYIAAGKRGEKSDVVLLQAPADREMGIDFSIKAAMALLWRCLIHNKTMFG